MIRFIDMGSQVYLDDDDVQHSFAFLDTITDKFVELDGCVYWDKWQDFVDSFEADLAVGGRARSLTWPRLSGLVPATIKPRKPVSDRTYIAGQQIAFTIYFSNGFAVTINSSNEQPLTHAEKVDVIVACLNYRNLALDPKSRDTNDAFNLTIDELMAVLTYVSDLTTKGDLLLAERNLHRILNR